MGLEFEGKMAKLKTAPPCGGEENKGERGYVLLGRTLKGPLAAAQRNSKRQRKLRDLKPAGWRGGQRQFDGKVLRRLVVIQRGQETGFTLDRLSTKLNTSFTECDGRNSSTHGTLPSGSSSFPKCGHFLKPFSRRLLTRSLPHSGTVRPIDQAR